MNIKTFKGLRIILYLIYTFFCFLMVKITLQYFPINFDVAFLRIKQQYIHLTHYKLTFYTHVIFAIFSLIAGFTQFSKTIRKRYSKIHKNFGWLYIVTVLIFAAPSGFIIGIYANGGILSQIAFCLLAVLWFWFTFKALKAIVNKNYKVHQTFMIRSFALTLSAITLRLWKYLIVYFFEPRPMDVYQIVAWLGWVLNLILAEVIIYKYYRQ